MSAHDTPHPRRGRCRVTPVAGSWQKVGGFDQARNSSALSCDLRCQGMSPIPTRDTLRKLTDEIVNHELDPVIAAKEALRCGDADGACQLLLAEAAAGRPPDARLVSRVLPDLSDLDLFPVLVGSCGGDRVEMLLDVVEQDRMSSERDAVALFLAVELLGGSSPPPRLLALLRTRLRRMLGIEASIVLAMTAKALGDKDVLEVAKPWLPMAEAVEAKSIREQLLRRLATPPLLALPEKSPPRVISGFTVRRPAPKVGRNDPCPCGSGKKYKKCCAEKDAERAWDPSPMPGLTRSEYLRSAGSELTSREVDLLRIQELAELNFPSLSTLPLIAALRRALIFHRLDLAESAMEALSTRTDFPGGGDADGYRAELIHVAVETDNLEFAKRHLDLLHDRKEAFQSDLITIELRSPSEQTLARLEQTALSGLQEPKGNALFDLSFALLRGSPALGILVARASLSAERPFDSDGLLEVIEEARDRLGLPPGDPAWEIYEQRLDRETARKVDELVKHGESAERERLVAEAEGLREKLRDSKSRIDELEQRMRVQEASLTRLSADQSSAPPTAPPASAPLPADEEERRRLRAKLAELKLLLAERNAERTTLRRQLAKMHETLATEEKTAEHAPEPREDEPSEEAAVGTPSTLLVPHFSASCEESLRQLPSVIARKALFIITSLASLDSATWRQVKRMVTASTPLLSCRIGIHHRAVFRVEEGHLTVLSIFHRKDLDTAVKRYG